MSFSNPQIINSSASQITPEPVPPLPPINPPNLGGTAGQVLSIRKDGTVGYSDPIVLNAKTQFGAKGDGRLLPTASMTAGQAFLTDPSGPFTILDSVFGRTFVIPNAGAGGDALVGVAIAFQSSTQITLNVAAVNTVGPVIAAGFTDDTQALLDFKNAIVTTGGRGYMPVGNYGITGSGGDFGTPFAFGWDGVNGNMATTGSNRLGAELFGAGSGAYDTNWASATSIWSAIPGSAISALGWNGTVSVGIQGLKMRGFSVKCLRPLGAANYAIYWDNINNSAMEDMTVAGYSLTGSSNTSPASNFATVGQGNGIRVNNFSSGQNTFKRVYVAHFGDATNGSIGWRIGSVTSPYAAGGGSANIHADTLTAVGVINGFLLDGGAAVNSAVFNNCGTTGDSTAHVGSYGYSISWDGAVFNGCHSEGHYNGAKFESASYANVWNGGYCTYFNSTVGDGSAAFNFVGSCMGNTVVSGLFAQFDFGAVFSATSSGNYVKARSFPGNPPLTSFVSMAGLGNRIFDTNHPAEAGDVIVTTNITAAGTTNLIYTLSKFQQFNVTTAGAVVIGQPAVNPANGQTAEVTIEIFNNTAGAIALTWGGNFKFAGGAWVSPGAGGKRKVTARWNGASWICDTPSSVDY